MSLFFKSLRFAVVGLPIAFIPQQKILNESKRKFYEDDTDVTPIPGTIISASATEIDALGPNKLIDGISVRSPKHLESTIQTIRTGTVELLEKAEQTAEEASKEYYETEQIVTGTVAALHDKHEDLLSGSLYVMTGILTGSILTRRRSFLLRFSGPVLVGLCAFRAFLPSTFQNTANFVYGLEKRNIPVFVKAQDSAVSGLKWSIESVDHATKSAEGSLISFFGKGKDLIKSVTGLNIDEDITKK